SDRVARRVTGGGTAKRSVALCNRGRVFHRERSTRRGEASQSPIEIRTSNSRSTLHDRKAIGREHERCNFGAQLLCCAKRRTVHLRPLPFPELDRHFELHLRFTSSAAERDPPSLLAKADKLRVGTCTRREALRTDVQRLEQIRLTGSIRSDHEHQPWLEVEVEPRVRPDVPE